jgi:glucose-6-phosphate 1-dehydrogenase
MNGTDSARPAGPCAMVVFGGAGDLMKRKLLPSLYHLAVDGLLAKNFGIVAFARNESTTEAFRAQIDAEVPGLIGGEVRRDVWQRLRDSVHYVRGEFAEAPAYGRLAETLAKIDEERGTGGNYLHYLATPPSFFLECAQQLHHAGLTAETPTRWRRIIVEKPFGHDLDSARTLNRGLQEVLDERQIYRIDHYLGKETVQNLLVFRFANGLFEPVWNQRYIDHVQITAAEKLGVENRGGYYEEAGALRDMVSNHLFQLLALTAMEPPVSFDADSVRDEKAKALRAIRPLDNADVLTDAVRGQYGEGMVDGVRVQGYRQETKVDPKSRTETFVALRLMVDNWRWAGVPFYVRTGKRMAARATEIAIRFRSVPHVLFRDAGRGGLPPNELVIRIQPNEGVSLRFGAKEPGPGLRIGDVRMDFDYADYFKATPSTGYETLLHDAIRGDATLFQRADNVEASWKALGPILDVWAALTPRDFPDYPAGSWGPVDADHLLSRDGRAWRNVI